MNTHYAVVHFSGDPAGEHPDPELNGSHPTLEIIACGPEEFCWESVAKWTKANSLREWETVEVLARDTTLVAAYELVLQTNQNEASA